MTKNFLTGFPGKSQLLEWYSKNGSNKIHNVNSHFHTPYSFSAFDDLRQVFEMAKEENVRILGINDFYTTAGYEEFHDLAGDYHVFPLFNIEFMGLLKEEQKQGIRVNDPNNPGRTYFSGKGLDYPLSLEGTSLKKVENVREESLRQAHEMLELASAHLQKADPDLSLDYEKVMKEYTRGMLRERHIARAVRQTIFKKYITPAERKVFLNRLYGGEDSRVNVEIPAALEGEIRSKLLKAGGPAFVPEDPKAFLEIDEIIRIINDAGGIPTYPVLLDDKTGNYTEYERNVETLHDRLTSKNIYSIELIPGRNDFSLLKEFVKYFHERDFAITFGTEHNTPELIPLEISTRGGAELDEELKSISFEGACIIAAHQYYRANGEEGYLERNGKPKIDEKDEFIELGNAVIEYHIQNQ